VIFHTPFGVRSDCGVSVPSSIAHCQVNSTCPLGYGYLSTFSVHPVPLGLITGFIGLGPW